MARYPVSKAGGRSRRPWGFDSLSFRSCQPRPVAQRRRAVGFEPTCRPFESGRGVSMRRRPTGRTPGCYPEDAGSSPAVAATCPDRLDGQEPVSSNDRRRAVARAISHSGRSALGRVWVCGPAVSRVRRVRFPSRASPRRSSVDERHAPNVGRRRFDSSRRDCVARLVASPRVVTPWSRVRFPGGAPCMTSTTGRLGRRRSDEAVKRGSIPRSSTFRGTSRRRTARGSDGTTAARSEGRNVHPASLRG